MLAVRYVTLLALAVWVGGLVTLQVLAPAPPANAARLEALWYICGALMLVGLLVQKFVGPPPRAFMVRMILVSAMLAVVIAGRFWPLLSPVSLLLDTALGLPLLFWYVRD